MSGMIESVTIVLELVAVMICLSFLYGKRIKINFYGAMLLVIYPAVFMGINWGHFPVYISMLAYVCIILYCMFSYKKGFRVTLVNFFLAFAIIGLLQLIFYIPVIYLLKIPKFCTVSNSHCVNLYTFFILLQHFFYQIIVFYTSF